jgi:hypothetical protein
MPPRGSQRIRARRGKARQRGANAPADVEGSAAGDETVTSSVAVPALTRQQALGPLLSRVVNDEDLAVLSVILEQMDDLNDVARLRRTCRVLRDGVDACMKMKRTVAGKKQERLNMNEDIPWQLMAWKRDWTREHCRGVISRRYGCRGNIAATTICCTWHRVMGTLGW